MEQRKVAVFDVDGTIFRSSLLIQIVDKLIERGSFEKALRKDYETQHMKWLDREGDYEEYIMAVVKVFRGHIKGLHYAELKEAAQDLVEEQWKRTYRYTRDLIKDLKSQGYFLLAVSHSPKTVLDEFCPKLGFDKAYGLIYEIGPSDLFTGSIADEHVIMNKGNIVKRAVEKENLTLTDSIGVGDTESDIPFLELVEQPICFNPNMKLYKYGKRNDWKVVVERKDVVYDL